MAVLKGKRCVWLYEYAVQREGVCMTPESSKKCVVWSTRACVARSHAGVYMIKSRKLIVTN